MTNKVKALDTESKIENQMSTSLNDSAFEQQVDYVLTRDPYDVLGIGHLALRVTQKNFILTFLAASVLMIICGVLDY